MAHVALKDVFRGLVALGFRVQGFGFWVGKIRCQDVVRFSTYLLSLGVQGSLLPSQIKSWFRFGGFCFSGLVLGRTGGFLARWYPELNPKP